MSLVMDNLYLKKQLEELKARIEVVERDRDHWRDCYLKVANKVDIPNNRPNLNDDPESEEENW